MRIERAVWTDQDRELWRRIRSHDFEPAGVALTFTARFARDHGWSLDDTRALVDEYRRFCFLAARVPGEITPSEEVDEVWHQHLTYSRDYWTVWCPEVLGATLHHGPTTGGARESRRFAAQYAATLASYEAWFGPPPARFWPGTAQRFGPRPRFRVIDTQTKLVLTLPRRLGALRGRSPLAALATIVAAVWPTGAAAQDLGVLDWTAVPFLEFYAVAALASLCGLMLLRRVVMRGPRGRGLTGQLRPVELALLAKGRQHAAHVLALEAIQAGRAKFVDGRVVIEGEALDRRALLRFFQPQLDRLQADLSRRGLALDGDDLWRAKALGTAAVLPIALVGCAKVLVGLSRERPVGILVVLIVATVLGAVMLVRAWPPATRQGRAMFAAYRRSHSRALRAPMAEEVVTAFACSGAAVLAGTALADFRWFVAPAKDRSGDSGCGSSGSGCGGGGCGGCGSGD